MEFPPIFFIVVCTTNFQMYVNYLTKSNHFYQIITIFEASFKCISVDLHVIKGSNLVKKSD